MENNMGREDISSQIIQLRLVSGNKGSAYSGLTNDYDDNYEELSCNIKILIIIVLYEKHFLLYSLYFIF